MDFGKESREWLEQEIRSEKYEDLLRLLHEKHPFLKSFGSWLDIIAFMHEASTPDSRKENVLRFILQDHHKDKDPRWRTILLLMFWPALRMLHFQKREWDVERGELWQNLVWSFMVTILQLDPHTCSRGLVQKLVSQTAYKLRDEYRRLHRHQMREIGVSQDELDKLAGGIQGIDFDALELREVQRAEIKRLLSHLETGTIKESDFLLLVSTRIYGEPLKDYTQRAGIPYQYAKRRRLQVEDKIARKEKEGKGN